MATSSFFDGLCESLHLPVSRIGFMQTDLDNFCSHFLKWQYAIAPRRDWNVQTNASASIADALQGLLPIPNAKRKILVVPTKNNWIALFENRKNGLEPSAMQHLCTVIRCHAIYFVALPEAAIQFEYYGFLQTDFLNYIRSVSLTN